MLSDPAKGQVILPLTFLPGAAINSVDLYLRLDLGHDLVRRNLSQY